MTTKGIRCVQRLGVSTITTLLNAGVALNAAGGTPGVVAIQTLRERAGFIETGPFDVRIILTEEPKGVSHGSDSRTSQEQVADRQQVTQRRTLKGATRKHWQVRWKGCEPVN